jgi:hypothetical protein
MTGLPKYWSVTHKPPPLAHDLIICRLTEHSNRSLDLHIDWCRASTNRTRKLKPSGRAFRVDAAITPWRHYLGPVRGHQNVPAIHTIAPGGSCVEANPKRALDGQVSSNRDHALGTMFATISTTGNTTGRMQLEAQNPPLAPRSCTVDCVLGKRGARPLTYTLLANFGSLLDHDHTIGDTASCHAEAAVGRKPSTA